MFTEYSIGSLSPSDAIAIIISEFMIFHSPVSFARTQNAGKYHMGEIFRIASSLFLPRPSSFAIPAIYPPIGRAVIK